MLKKNSKRYLIISLVLIEMISLFLTMKSFSNKPIEEIKEINEVDKKHFSMFINDGAGNYSEYTTSNLFPQGYKLNMTKSKCIDTKGNELDGILSGAGNSVTVTSTKTAYCYLYFDEGMAVDTILANAGDDLWNSTLEDDGYRYVGTDPANYVCFGYSDASEDCDFTSATNTDLYAYRIIGIFEDSEGIQHLKLIKKEALNTAYMWNEDYSNDVNWENSDLYKGLNGISGGVYSNLFVGSDAYSYMSTSSEWYNKIETWKWTATNTQTYYIAESAENEGVNYYNSWPIGIHNSEHEIDTTTGCYQTSSGSAINCKTTASYTYPEAKIGLMYASDYALSLGETAASMTGSINTNRTTLKTGWMHISNNDSGAPYQYEWTSSRYGAGSYGYYYAWYVFSKGYVSDGRVGFTYSVRPVFYLTADTKIESGSGSSGDPYIIYQEPTDTEKLIENVSSDELWDSTLENDGYRYVGENPANYVCFGYSDVSEDCDFTNATNTDLYAYRIIGIFEDESGEQHLKLIKKEIITTNMDDYRGYIWNSDCEIDVDWEYSDLYKRLNNDYFLNNITYIPTGWSDKIETWTWTATSTQTYNKYDMGSVVSNIGTNYYDSWPIGIYNSEHEIDTTTGCYDYNSDATNCKTTASYTYPKAKIGLMYVSDYALSLGETTATMTGSTYTSASTLKTGWMHISNNDSDAYQYEWTSTFYGPHDGGCPGSYTIYSSGFVDYVDASNAGSVRPVFYLKSDVTISGTGTESNPYIIGM